MRVGQCISRSSRLRWWGTVCVGAGLRLLGVFVPRIEVCAGAGRGRIRQRKHVSRVTHHAHPVGDEGARTTFAENFGQIYALADPPDLEVEVDKLGGTRIADGADDCAFRHVLTLREPWSRPVEVAKEHEIVSIALAFPKRVAQDDRVAEQVADEQNLGVDGLMLEIE